MKITNYNRDKILNNPLKYADCKLVRFNKIYLLLDINMNNKDILLIDITNGGYTVINSNELIIASGIFTVEAYNYNANNVFYFKDKIYQKQFNK